MTTKKRQRGDAKMPPLELKRETYKGLPVVDVKDVAATRPDNGIEPVSISPEEAQATLRQEAERRIKHFNDELIRLSNETGYTISPFVVFMNKEEPLLDFLKSLGIEAMPMIKIVPRP